MIHYNFVVFVFFFLLISTIIYSFILVPLRDKKKFALFEMRDRLCHCVMNKKVDEESEEFRFLIKSILYAIKSHNKDFFKAYLFFKFRIESDNNYDAIIKIRQKIHKNKYLSEILVEYEKFVIGHLSKYIFIFKLFKRPFIIIFIGIYYIDLLLYDREKLQSIANKGRATIKDIAEEKISKNIHDAENYKKIITNDLSVA
ncbi:MAG TPA: hypothetical protein PKG52_03215 [bacterium]|nr:hypothetical protein [bacterium]